jgi:hypothetical protein
VGDKTGGSGTYPNFSAAKLGERPISPHILQAKTGPECATQPLFNIYDRFNIEFIILRRMLMPRLSGDKNRTIREHKLIAEKEVLKARLVAAKAQLKAARLRIKELGERL